MNRMRMDMKLIDNDTATRRAETLKALGHPIRLRIIYLLNVGEQNVGELAKKLAHKSAIISQQLKILRLSGLVEVEKRNGHSFYRLANPHLSTLLECLKSCDRSLTF